MIRWCVGRWWTLATAVTAIVLTIAILPLHEPSGALLSLVPARIDEISRGQWWRLMTGPFVHVTQGHLLWDLTILTTIGIAYETKLKRVWPWLIAAALVLPTWLSFAVNPQMHSYYGLSGVTHAMLAAVLTWELCKDKAHWIAAAVALWFVCKLAWGIWGTPIMGPELGSAIRETPFLHCAGALVGVVFGLLATKRPTVTGLRPQEAH